MTEQKKLSEMTPKEKVEASIKATNYNSAEQELRKKEIAKAIKELGWFEISKRIKTESDRQLYNELSSEFDIKSEAEIERRLRKMGIDF